MFIETVSMAVSALESVESYVSLQQFLSECVELTRVIEADSGSVRVCCQTHTQMFTEAVPISMSIRVLLIEVVPITLSVFKSHVCFRYMECKQTHKA